jgi:urease accessory protein
MAEGIGMSEENPFSCIAGEGGERSEPDEGEARKRHAASQAARPSPSHYVGPSLSRGAGEGLSPWLPNLLTWLSPSYPVGGFSYSHGLEWAVESGAVQDRHSLEDYVATILETGAGWVDLVLLAEAWRTADAPDAVIELAAAWRGTAETALEAAQQGAAFVSTTCAAWPGTALDHVVTPPAYPVAVGLACAGTVPLDAALLAYVHALAANFVSAGIRLIPLGQTDGQRTLAALAPRIVAVAERAATASLDEIGTAAFGIDLCSIRHETQYTRLFRS